MQKWDSNDRSKVSMIGHWVLFTDGSESIPSLNTHLSSHQLNYVYFACSFGSPEQREVIFDVKWNFWQKQDKTGYFITTNSMQSNWINTSAAFDTSYRHNTAVKNSVVSCLLVWLRKKLSRKRTLILINCYRIVAIILLHRRYGGVQTHMVSDHWFLPLIINVHDWQGSQNFTYIMTQFTTYISITESPQTDTLSLVNEGGFVATLTIAVLAVVTIGVLSVVFYAFIKKEYVRK